MAKPGTDEARRLAQMSRQAVDLGGGGDLPEPLKRRMQQQVELQRGKRCRGCKRRIRSGFQFTSIEILLQEGKPIADTRQLAACDGFDGCDFAEKARVGATFVEPIQVAWLDEMPDDVGAQSESEPERSDGAGG